MRLSSMLTAGICGLALSSAAAALEAAAPPPPPGNAPAAEAAAVKAPVAAPSPQPGATNVPETATGKKAKSEDCYRQADAKNLHGKERKHFHKECMNG